MVGFALGTLCASEKLDLQVLESSCSEENKTFRTVKNHTIQWFIIFKETLHFL